MNKVSGRLFSRKYFAKYFAIFYMLIVLTSLISSSIIFYLSNRSIENEIHNRNKILLNNVITAIDDKYRDIVNELMHFEVQETTKIFSNEIYINDKFHYSPNLKVISSLGSIKTKYTGVKDVILFFRENNYLFSPDGMTYFDSYFKNTLLVNNNKISAVKGKLTSLERINVENINKLTENYNSDGKIMENANCIIMSIPLASYKNLGMTISLIIDSAFFDFFMNNYNEINTNLTIIDSKGEHLISIGDNILDIKDIRDNMDKINTGIESFRLKTSRSSISVTIGKSDINWRYITAVPYEYITSQTRYIKNIMLNMMILFIILGFAAAYRLGNWQYKPIQTLIDYIRSIPNNQESDGKNTFIEDNEKKNTGRQIEAAERVNEFTYIRQSIGYLQSLNVNMKQFIDDSMPVLKQNIIYKLLHGLYNKDNYLEEDFEKYNIDLHSKYYTVLVLNYVKNKSVNISIKEYLNIRNNVASLVMQFLNAKCQGYYAEINLENSAVIIGFNNDTDINELNSICISIIDFFNSRIKAVRLTISIGMQTSSIFDVSGCYSNAFSIIDNRSVSSLSEVIFHDLDSSSETGISVKELKVYQIINYIIDGMYDQAADEFRNAVKSLFINEPTYAQLIKASTGLHKEICNFLLTKDVSNDNIMQLEIILLSELNNIYSINEYNDRIRDYFNGLRNILENSLSPEKNNIVENVKSYVRENYNDSDLYLGKLALGMNITSNYISHIFKAGTGMSFPEYLAMIRIEKAKELLVNTKTQINDISCQCGYANISTFMRSFKNIAGTSPGKYRNMYGISQ